MTSGGTIKDMRPHHWRICQSVLDGMTVRQAAAEHGVSISTVAAIMRGAGYKAHVERVVTWVPDDA